jgi:cyclic lactone autoinducer peptide
MKTFYSLVQGAKKFSLHASTSFLAAFAIFFASVACTGHMHEPQVPKKLQK